MKAIYTKLSLYLLFSCTVLVAAESLIISEENRREDFRKLFDESIAMKIATFKKRINAANLTEKLIEKFVEDLFKTDKRFSWRDPGKKMLFLIEKFSPKMLESLNVRGFMSVILLWAYEKNDRNLIKKLRESGGDLSDVLNRAVQPRPELIPMLLKDGALPKVQTIMNYIADHRRDDAGYLLRLLKGMRNINERDEYGNTVLFWAPNKEIAAILLDAGVSINAKDSGGYTKLIRSFEYLVSLRMSLEKTGKLSKVSEDLMKLNHELVTYLIQKGADPTIKNNKGESALSIAQKAGFTDLIALLEGKKEK